MIVLVGQMVRSFLLVNMIVFAVSHMALPAAADAPVRIVAFGDSLTAGFNLKASDAFPAQLERLLKSKGLPVEIANAGVSGDTTAAGLERFDWAVPDGTEAVILELGANDALRGLSPVRARANLEEIIRKLKARNIEILLAGMRAPRNLGDEYANAFDAIFPELAEKYGLILYPFFLTGVVLDPKLNLGDGLHPNARGVAIIAEKIAPQAEELIARVKALRGQPPGG